MARKVVSENPTAEPNRKMSGFCICILQTPTFYSTIFFLAMWILNFTSSHRLNLLGFSGCFQKEKYGGCLQIEKYDKDSLSQYRSSK